ncbi:hypothetical protein C8Q76DRAFT_122140 [Earliella scabrosa]|nr:hypothetical protein C8Q76DRAFT_122140 [Earliella scabrosa]
MYRWYADSSVCYAYLSDVSEDAQRLREEDASFRHSRWFQRGWTLQELIAPRVVIFLNANWDTLGTKSSLIRPISDITGIEELILNQRKSVRDVNVATRMSWAAERQTTRPEDGAYSLMGLFDVHMPTLYGEGLTRAFIRLQEEILKQEADQTLFAWGTLDAPTLPLTVGQQPLVHSDEDDVPGLTFSTSFFAHSPAQFWEQLDLQCIGHEEFLRRPGMLSRLGDFPAPEYHLSPYGARTQLPLIPIGAIYSGRNPVFLANAEYLAVLPYEARSREGELIAIPCGRQSLRGVTVFKRQYFADGFRIASISDRHISAWRQHLDIRTVYLPRVGEPLVRPVWIPPLPRFDPNDFKVSLAEWVEEGLKLQGYTVESGYWRHNMVDNGWHKLWNDKTRTHVSVTYTVWRFLGEDGALSFGGLSLVARASRRYADDHPEPESSSVPLTRVSHKWSGEFLGLDHCVSMGLFESVTKETRFQFCVDYSDPTHLYMEIECFGVEHRPASFLIAAGTIPYLLCGFMLASMFTQTRRSNGYLLLFLTILSYFGLPEGIRM